VLKQSKKTIPFSRGINLDENILTRKLGLYIREGTNRGEIIELKGKITEEWVIPLLAESARKLFPEQVEQVYEFYRDHKLIAGVPIFRNENEFSRLVARYLWKSYLKVGLESEGILLTDPTMEGNDEVLCVHSDSLRGDNVVYVVNGFRKWNMYRKNGCGRKVKRDLQRLESRGAKICGVVALVYS